MLKHQDEILAIERNDSMNEYFSKLFSGLTICQNVDDKIDDSKMIYLDDYGKYNVPEDLMEMWNKATEYISNNI